ncbi:putative replication initiation protein [Staphylococcus cohnii subsp. cohnii]|nr:putative replication initiation protein [Staphylococcus cohnii subsp. cohnii]
MTNEENQKFTKLHKFLFTDEIFKPMKAKSKLLYALITERQSLSALDVKTKKDQSQFLDKENRLFSIYSNDELSEMLHVSKPTIINLKKELVHKGLLEEIRVPNANNRLYPKKPYDEYFYANDLDEFYRLPHTLFSNPYYKKLSPDAIITYAIYLSRYEYSVFKDNFYDKNQRLYFIYPNDVLGDYLNFDRNKIARIKKQLIDYNLLEVKKSNRADMLYIKPPKACYDTEIKKCSIGKLKNAALGNQKMQHREIKNCSTSYTDFSNTNISDIDSSDTNDMNDIREVNVEDTKPNHPNHTNHLQQQSDEEALKYLELQEMPEDTKRYMNNFSAKEIQIIKSVILKAKRSFNDMYDEMYMLEDMDDELLTVLKRFKGIMVKKQETVEAMQGYLMRSILSELEEMRSTNMRRKNFENSPLNVFKT